MRRGEERERERDKERDGERKRAKKASVQSMREEHEDAGGMRRERTNGR